MNIVKHPKHYNFFDTETKLVIGNELSHDEFLGWCKGCAMKYRLRAGKKLYPGKTMEESILIDIGKADEFDRIYNEYYPPNATKRTQNTPKVDAMPQYQSVGLPPTATPDQVREALQCHSCED